MNNDDLLSPHSNSPPSSFQSDTELDDEETEVDEEEVDNEDDFEMDEEANVGDEEENEDEEDEADDTLWMNLRRTMVKSLDDYTDIEDEL